MCMLASYQKDAMLNGERKALNDSSFVAFTVNEKTTHIDVCIGMCVIESVSQMEVKRVCVHVFMNGGKCAREKYLLLLPLLWPKQQKF